MTRISIVGASGAGKTTLARAAAARLQVPHIELDALFHQPGWTELPRAEFRAVVAERVAGDAWVACGNYSAVQDLVWARADTVVWLDPPRRTATRRVTVRTLERAVLRRELWNGNREQLRNVVRWDPERNIIRWTWTRHGVYRARYQAASVDPRWAHLRFVRLASRREVARWLEGLTATSL
jgi:adenylate kinase family enzyme